MGGVVVLIVMVIVGAILGVLCDKAGRQTGGTAEKT
jgi:hypothetical protein